MIMLPTSTKFQLCLLICQIFVSTMSIKLQEELNYNYLIMDAMVNITKSCKTYGGSSTIVVGQFCRKDIQKLFSSSKSMILSNDERLFHNQMVQDTVQTLMISTSSSIDVENFLVQVQKSSVWNHLRFNIISYKVISRRSCNRAESYLFTAWKNDLLNTIFLCMSSENIVKVYTYNPYSKQAPEPWKFIRRLHDGENYWYLFMIIYEPDTITCDILFFDKTRKLDEYKGTRVVSYVPLKANSTNIYYNSHNNVKKRFDLSMISILFNEMNISVSHKINNEYGAVDDNGNLSGVDKYLASNFYDLLIDHRFLTYTRGELQSTFILGDSGITFISHHRSNVPILLQIVYYFKPIVILFSLIFLGLTIAILKLSVEESFDTAAIEVFRLFFNGPILKVPRTAPPRIYLFTVLIFILIMQTILQSKMLSFIMAPMTTDLNTFADLEKHKNYIIYCKQRYKHLIPPEIASRAIITNSYNGLFDQNQVSLIWEASIAVSSAGQYHMHHAREIISKYPIVHVTRKSWPLISRVNEIYIRLLESGISDFEMKSAIFYTTYNRTDDHDNQNSRRVLTLSDLNFAFQILICGFICSFISFMIEIKFWSYFSLSLNCMVQIFND